MWGVRFVGPGTVAVVDDLPEPTIQQPRDAIVKVTRAGICGSDLHPFRGEIPSFQPGTVLGHEFVGVVVDVGPEAAVTVGDTVVASDLVACGRCPACRRREHYHCPDSTLFGYSNVVGEPLPGGQAEYVRVPYADVVLSGQPEGIDQDDLLFVGDVATTGLTAARNANILPGSAVAVIGAGALGLLAARCARALGAGSVIVSDPHAGRRQFAEALGLVTASPDDLADRLTALTGAPTAPSVIEAVGHPAALRDALAVAAPRGTVAVVGAHGAEAVPFDARTAFVRELTIRFLVGDPIATRDEVVDLLRFGLLLPSEVVSHRLPLADAAHAYALFERGDATKVLLHVDQ